MVLFTYFVIITTFSSTFACADYCSDDVWEKVPCNEYFQPENCDFQKIPLVTVDDYYRCGPAKLKISERNYYLGASGRRITYNGNTKAFRRIRIVPKILRDVSKNSTEISTLRQKISFPIGFSPTAYHKFATPLGEIATVRAIANTGSVMILSSYATTTIEDVAKEERGSSHLWMQVYLFKNRSLTEDIVRRAERAGFEAIVVTVDSPVPRTLNCNPGAKLFKTVMLKNVPDLATPQDLFDSSLTFKNLKWLTRFTKLPVVAKGILSGEDAERAIDAGVRAILVSNHGGRELDSDPATIDVLPSIVRAVNRMKPRRDVYLDSGIRNGWDVYKAIASGAKMVFIGRPYLFGLAEAGENGARDVLYILRREFQEAMLLAGSSNPSEIREKTLIRCKSKC